MGGRIPWWLWRLGGIIWLIISETTHPAQPQALWGRADANSTSARQRANFLCGQLEFKGSPSVVQKIRHFRLSFEVLGAIMCKVTLRDS